MADTCEENGPWTGEPIVVQSKHSDQRPPFTGLKSTRLQGLQLNKFTGSEFIIQDQNQNALLTEQSTKRRSIQFVLCVSNLILKKI